MSGLLVICKQCLTEYEPSHEDIMQGYSWWSLCPRCRVAPNNERDVTKRYKKRPSKGGEAP